MEAYASRTFWLEQVLELQQLLFDECTDLGGEEVPLCIVHLCVLLVASITSNSDWCKDLGGGEVPLCMCVLLVAIASNCFASAAD